MGYWNKRIECMERTEMRALQTERLKRVVDRVYHNCQPYRERMQAAGVKPEDIQSIDDIKKLPFTSKKDLRDYYPWGLLSVPLSQIVKIHTSSGTTGKPIVVGYTRNDIADWAEAGARCLTAYGLGKDDVIQVSYGYGLFTGGLGAHDAAMNIGATTIPTSAGNTEKQLLLMHDLGTTALACTPSYALYLSESLEKSGIPRNDIKLKVGIFGAEPWTEEMRKEIEYRLGIKAYDIYGLTEISGPGVGFECEYQNGTHLSEDLFYPEIINPETGEVLPDGTEGELVFTTLNKEGMPLIRFRTRDITSITHERCACGRTLAKMSRILARTDDMLIIRGVNVFPSQVEAVLCTLKEVEPHFFITVDRVNNTDTFDIDVEIKEEFYSDMMSEMEKLRKKIAHAIQSVVGIQPNIRPVAPNTIERSQGKAKRVMDKRKFK